MEKAVVLVSGGLDSAVTLALAAQQYELILLHFNYGQLTERREGKAFRALADHYRVNERLEINMRELGQFGNSSLTDKKLPVPEGLKNDQQIPSTYVPFRNGLMLAYAAALAEVKKGKHIFIGVVQTDSPGYPDCRSEFIIAMEKAINLGRKPESKVLIHTPIINLAKSEVVNEGIILGVPFEMTWSCYQREDIACGKCTSCLGRLEAFQNAGFKDPLKYCE
ncbi:7-cyano-7-deazaguanine synthase QueC [bacterium]|nr:7-cyano-7-deazaguanine synthase QueC [bacterium]